jgi:hypothetical protein
MTRWPALVLAALMTVAIAERGTGAPAPRQARGALSLSKGAERYERDAGGSGSNEVQRAAKKPAAKPAAKTVIEPAAVTCPSPLGTGLASKRAFCDVLSGRDPAAGIIVKLPPHAGPAKLRFDLHNRHTFSEEQVKAGRAYARYTATIGALARKDGALISRAVVQSEFRKGADLVDRISGGAGPGGVKAVAPTGREPIEIEIPANVDEVGLLGEKVTIETLEGRETFSATGRPIAIVSNIVVEYRPAPARRRR